MQVLIVIWILCGLYGWFSINASMDDGFAVEDFFFGIPFCVMFGPILLWRIL